MFILQPDLQANEAVMRNKINLLCLMEVIFLDIFIFIQINMQLSLLISYFAGEKIWSWILWEFEVLKPTVESTVQ